MSRTPRRCGPVTLITPVGSGGSGEVWLGRRDGDDDDPRNLLVVKRFSPSIAVDIDDILDSAQLVRGLDLEHVSSVIDAGVDDEQAWVASPWIDGLDVRALLAQTCDEGLDSDVAVLIASDILRGLSALHACGLVHRDVSPANVMLDRLGRAVVVDLDFVCRSGMAATETVPGTVAYMSPEHAQGLPVDARADLYVWAIVAYEILIGDAFYGDLGDGEVLRLARTGGYRPRRFSVLSPALQQVLLKALAPDPTDRFTDATTLLSAFTSSSSSSSSSSRPALAALVDKHAGPTVHARGSGRAGAASPRLSPSSSSLSCWRSCSLRARRRQPLATSPSMGHGPRHARCDRHLCTRHRLGRRF